MAMSFKDRFEGAKPLDKGAGAAIGAKKPTVAKEEYYTVVAGDNLTKIAGKFGTTVNQLVEWNSIKNPDLINVGQQLRVK